MIGVVDKEIIRRLHYVQEWPIRRIARELGYARQTVRRALQDSDPPRYKLSRSRPKPVMGDVEAIIEKWLEEDAQQPPKQRHTARRIWQRLKDEYNFRGAESTIRRHVGQIRRRLREAFIPLEFDPGERAQVDWGEAKVVLAGAITDVQLFCARLLFSGMPFVKAYLHQSQEAFFDGHRSAFEFWGGVPKAITYDNTKLAITKILRGRNRDEHERFASLRMHYLFIAEFCEPGKAHQKGSVENLVGYFRRNFLSPMPEFRSIEELNAYLLERCQKEAARCMEGKKTTIGQLCAAERAHLIPLPPKPFDCSKEVPVKVNRSLHVMFETNRYSVPAEYVNRRLLLKATIDRIRIYDGPKLVAEHARSHERNQVIDDYRHYLPVLERKPWAVKNALPLRNAKLPAVYEALRQGLCARSPQGNREFVRVPALCLVPRRESEGGGDFGNILPRIQLRGSEKLAFSGVLPESEASPS